MVGKLYFNGKVGNCGNENGNLFITYKESVSYRLFKVESHVRLSNWGIFVFVSVAFPAQ